jgi:hypothetical protein
MQCTGMKVLFYSIIFDVQVSVLKLTKVSRGGEGGREEGGGSERL